MKKTKLKPIGRPKNDSGRAWVGRALRLRRAELCLSASVVGEAIGVTSSTIYSWELDSCQPPKDKVAALCALFGCKPAYFTKAPRLTAR